MANTTTTTTVNDNIESSSFPPLLYDIYMEQCKHYGELILNWADPTNEFRGHTQGWFLTEFNVAITIAILYVSFVIIGSTIMKLNILPAMSLYPIQFVYNVSQIFLCAYMTIEAAMIGYRNEYTFFSACNPFHVTTAPTANLLWLFYISKVWDFWDTIFIVMNKKWRQLSFLHVYHHTTIFLFYWLNVNVNYDGDIFLTILLNGFIHTVMYTYYFICMHTKVPETGKSLPIWWKSSLTMMQLVQFVTMMSQGTYMLYNQCTRTSPRRVVISYIVYILSLFILFAQFFMASYMKPKQSRSSQPPKIKRA